MQFAFSRTILPTEYIYPKRERGLRELARQRMHLVQHRSSLITSVQNQVWRSTAVRLRSDTIKGRGKHPWPEISDPDLALSVKAGRAAIDTLTAQIERLENLILKRVELSPQFRMLKTVSGSRVLSVYRVPITSETSGPISAPLGIAINGQSEGTFLMRPPQVCSSDTLARIASGNEQHGAFAGLKCAACHRDQGVSRFDLIPTLAGQNSTVLYKQLDDYRSNKRLWGVTSAIATALTDQDSADVVTYFARRPGGLAPIVGEGVPEGGRSLRQRDTAIRFVFAGDPERGTPPCAACHGPGAQKISPPGLRGQHTAYIERQLTAFAEGTRQNDINERCA